MSEIVYAIEKSLDVSEFIEVLKNSTLAVRRPINDEQRVSSMCNNANLIVTARVDGTLVGVARSITDFVYCTYLSDLAVDVKFQKTGIGKKLIEETKKATPQAKLILLSAPAAVDYYPRIGMTKHNHCYYLDELKDLK
ncbi:MAG: GNAT family N-acetyltransferase [Ignavibacteriales bacterium]|nr:GNAT family N-acetyltransferase [Ignavibacteriales bacterium]MBP9120214.1 GNAT family N-acetyltransferase [Ignavibacterium sp.]